MLTLQIKEKEIESLTPEEEFIRGTVGAKCQINFDEFWQGYEKYIVFKRVGYEPINIMVDSLENEIEIPYTILAEIGEFKIGVFGITETETLPTLYSKDIKILYGTDTHGTTPPTYTPSEIDQLRLSKQDKLVSGENIKTINNQSILGSGNITIEGGSDVEVDQNYNPESENAQSGKAVAEAVAPKLDKPDSDGTTGQILGLDDNLLPAWIVPRQRFLKKIASYTVSETGISSVQMTIPAKTRMVLVTGDTNTSQTFGGIIVRFKSFTSESMLAQSTNLSLSHRECSCCVMFGDDIIGVSSVSANNNITLLGNMLPNKKNYLDYIDRNDNNIRIEIYGSSTIKEFPEHATFDLYVVTED